MNILIIEDEILASKKLEILIAKLIPNYKIVGIAKSVQQAIKLISENNIDLGFFDIQIEDGLSFDIFDKTDINFPIIFTTAFNEYAVKAFKLNSIDYLLKPISEPELKNAINKYNKHWNTENKKLSPLLIDEIKSLMQGNYKERFTIKTGNKLKIINTKDICYFFSQDKGTYAKTIDNKDNLLDYTLENIFPLLNNKHFFRISRKFIVNINHIKDIYSYSNSRLKVNLVVDNNDELIVSREKVRAFKEWLA